MTAVRIATTIEGVGEPTFVLLHGLASSRRIWDLVIPYLKKAHKVIAPDLRGHGETEKPERGYTLEDFALDLDELLRRYGVTRPVIVGHSAGANIALHHAVTRKSARGLVLVEGGVVELHAHLSWEQARERLAPPPDDPYQIDKWVREGPRELPATPQLVEIRRSLFEWGRDSAPRKRLTRERHLAILRSLWEQDVHDDLARAPCPTLVIVARLASAAATEQQWAERKAIAAARVARLPGIALQWFEDTIHDAPLQRPRELAEAILAFAGGTAR